MVLGYVLDYCICFGELLCFRDYCVGFGRCFGFCFVLWVWCCVGRCFVFGIVFWIIVFVLGGALCIAGLVLGGSVFCNFCCISF